MCPSVLYFLNSFFLLLDVLLLNLFFHVFENFFKLSLYLFFPNGSIHREIAVFMQFFLSIPSNGPLFSEHQTAFYIMSCSCSCCLCSEFCSFNWSFAACCSCLAICHFVRNCLFGVLSHGFRVVDGFARAPQIFWISTRLFPPSVLSAPVTFILNLTSSSSLSSLQPALSRLFFEFAF